MGSMTSFLLALAGASRTAADDQKALERMARGDHDALAELYDRHGRLVFSLALRVVGDQRDAEDVAQEVFAQAWRQAPRFDAAARGNAVAWLLTLTRSRAIDLLRRRRARLESAAAPDSIETPDGAAGPEQQVEWQGRAAAVRRAVETLPLLQRIAVELAFFEGLTHAEIAEQLDVPLGTVKTRVRQGLLKLRDHLAGAME
jgi:RNA polymerase sigma-70 factor, ECF subfamily